MSSGQPSVGLQLSKLFFCDLDKLKTSGSFVIFTNQNAINREYFHHILASRITSSQLLPSNLFTNILFHIHKKYWIQDYSSLQPAYRNRHVKVPEGPWMADVGAAQPGWRLKTPNMQPLPALTSCMMSTLQFELMYFWIAPADLWHINISGCSTLLKAPFQVLDVRTNLMFSKLLNSLAPEYQWVNWPCKYISSLYFIKFRNASQVLYLLVRSIP